ncbi:hypothetical protein L211DRAFT_788898, partial [Terfezia boudieri ATCC MYA-4762]
SEEEITALLHRLSQKDTVTSVMVLARADGAIIRVAGALANPIETRGLVAEYAGVVWRYVRASEEMVGGDDDLKLLRVRTRRGELVIVPEGRFILVVVHDTPGK